MPKGNKKQRHKAKREAKRLDARRRESISPIRRLAETPGEIECWMSQNFQAMGQCQIYVYKRAGGLSGIACFLVDRGVVGLKDAWARMNVDRLEFKDMLDGSARRNIMMSRVTLDDARRMIAGAIRWAYENGMRLPKDWTKTATLIGGVGEWMKADVSLFVKEFAGHPQDLRQRLIGEPFDTYIRRSDIAFVFSDAAPYEGRQTGEYVDVEKPDLDERDDFESDELESMAADLPDEEINVLGEQLTPLATMLAKETATWLAARNQTPSSELIEAWRSLALAAMISKVAMPDAAEDEVVDFGSKLMGDLSGRIETPRGAEYRKAVSQAIEHLQTDPLMMQEAERKYGLAGESGEAADES